MELIGGIMILMQVLMKVHVYFAHIALGSHERTNGAMLIWKITVMIEIHMLS